MVTKSLSETGFCNPNQKQHYAQSHIEFVAYRKLGGLKLNGELWTAYPHVMHKQPEWKEQFEVYQRKQKDHSAQRFVALYDDVIQGKVTTLDEFYLRFNQLQNYKRGKAAKLQKRTNAGIRGAIDVLVMKQ